LPWPIFFFGSGDPRAKLELCLTLVDEPEFMRQLRLLSDSIHNGVPLRLPGGNDAVFKTQPGQLSGYLPQMPLPWNICLPKTAGVS
jgi:hypothetical protein